MADKTHPTGFDDGFGFGIREITETQLQGIGDLRQSTIGDRNRYLYGL